MTDRERLAVAAILLLGERWQRPLAKVLGVNERTARRWAKGSPLPVWLLPKMDELLLARRKEIDAVITAPVTLL